MDNKNQKNKFNIKKLGKNLISRFFGFEEGIDITNELEVLKRRNTVIKSIIFISNMFYFLLMLIVSIVAVDVDNKMFNWVITLSTFPLTFVINYFLKLLIFKGEQEGPAGLARQQIAMYFAVGYLFISAMLFYLKVHNIVGLETFAYILFYYVIAIVALYQNKRVLINSGLLLFSILTILHFFATYDSPKILQQGLIESKLMLVDIGLRSLIYIVYMISLYATVSLAQSMHMERVSELLKRKEVETDFKEISIDLFKVVLSSSRSFFDETKAYQIYQIANRIGEIYGLSEKELSNLKTYSLIHLRHDELEGVATVQAPLQYHHSLKEKTDLASNISKRIQLSQKCEDIARGQTESTLSDSFVQQMNLMQPTIEAQIILLSDLYITMRSVENYKRPLSHANVIKIFENEFYVFFEKNLLQRFMTFHLEFAKIYDNFN